MNILISNDDGYLSQGIATLARIAGEFANVRVVAPERDRSGVSNSLTLDRPLKIRSAENGFYYVSARPPTASTSACTPLPTSSPTSCYQASTTAQTLATTPSIQAPLPPPPKPI